MNEFKHRITFTPCDYYKDKYELLSNDYFGFFVGIGHEGSIEDGIDTFHIIVLDNGKLLHVYDPKPIRFIFDEKKDDLFEGIENIEVPAVTGYTEPSEEEKEELERCYQANMRMGF